MWLRRPGSSGGERAEPDRIGGQRIELEVGSVAGLVEPPDNPLPTADPAFASMGRPCMERGCQYRNTAIWVDECPDRHVCQASGRASFLRRSVFGAGVYFYSD